jgi:hypothetical protein
MRQYAGIDLQAMDPAGAPPKAEKLDARRVSQGRRQRVLLIVDHFVIHDDTKSAVDS